MNRIIPFICIVGLYAVALLADMLSLLGRTWRWIRRKPVVGSMLGKPPSGSHDGKRR